MKNVMSNVSANRVLAVVFILFILHTGMAAVPDVIVKVSDTAKAEEHSFTAMRDAIDKIYTDGMLSTKLEQSLWQNKGTYINLNGLMARLIGQRYVNERVLMNNGNLTSYSEKMIDINPSVTQIKKLYEKQKEQGKDFLYVMAPIQISKYDPQMPIGYQKDLSNEGGDALIRELKRNHVPVLDLREKMYEQGIDHADAFFKTDHHWKPQTGFWAYGEIIKRLEEIEAIPEIDPFYIDLNQYEFQKFEHRMLGSAGKRVGKYYAGVDDFYKIVPDFETNITIQIPSINLDLTGPFEDVMYNKSEYEKVDYFNCKVYDSYLHANRDYTHLYNAKAPIKKKALLLGDSFSLITSPLLSLCIETCDKLDMRYYSGDFAEYYTEFDPDLIIILISSPGSGANATYDFFPDEVS